MDPAGTLVSIATILATLQELSESFPDAPATLVSIQSQVRIVQDGVRRVHEWMHFTDPTSKGQVQESLQESIATVDASVKGLQEDLEDLHDRDPKGVKDLERQGSDQWTKTKPAWNEPRIRKHLIDMREVALLLSFTLTVCQLPTGPPAEQAVKELSTGARTLSRAHKSTHQKRQSMLTKAKVQGPEEHSVEFNNFIEGVLDAEEGLPVYTETKDISAPDDVEDHPAAHQTSEAPEITSTKFMDAEHTSPKPRPDELFIDSPRGAQPDHDPKISQLLPNDAAPASDACAESCRGPASMGAPSLARSRTEKTPKLLAELPVTDMTSTLEKVPARTISRKPVRSSTGSQNRKLESHIGDARSSEKIMVVANGFVDSDQPSLNWPISSLPESTHDPLADLSPTSDISQKQACDDESQSSSPPPYATPVSHQAPERTLPSSDATTSPVDSAQNPLRTRQSQSGQASSRLDSVDNFDCPELIHGVRSKLEDFVRVLLDQDADTEVREKSTGRTALMEAACLSQREICRLIIKAGGRPNQKDLEGRTALHIAASRNDTIVCRMLLDAGAHIDANDRDGCTPLRIAARSGSDEAAACLLELLPAQKANDPDVIKAFLDTVKNGDIATAMEFLTKHINLKTLKEPWKPVVYAAQSGNFQMLDLVLVQKSALKASDPDGLTVLHHAAQHGHHGMVERLLDMGVSWKAQTKQRKDTALHLAIAAQQNAAAQVLIQHKDAKVTISDVDAQEPIHLATRTGDFNLVTSLLTRGAKLKSKSAYGWRPVHIAAAYGHVALMASFVTHGVDIEERLDAPSFKPQKKTNEAARRGYWAEIRWPHEEARPLHLAIEFGHAEMAKLLLASGAKMEVADSQRWQPLHYAAFHCQPEIVEMLLARGASPHAATQDGNTPLGLGFREHGLGEITQGDRERVQFLLQDAAVKQPKSPFAQVVQFRLGSAGTRTARERNQAWHTAEMAEALYRDRSDGADEYTGDGESEVSGHSGQQRQDVGSPSLSSGGHSFDRRKSSFSLRKSFT